MKLNTKSIIVVAVVVLVLFAGWRFLSSFRKPAPPPQAVNPYGVFGPAGAGMPDMMQMAQGQAAMYELMNKYHLGTKAANFIAQSKMQILDQTDTSLHFAITFPSQTKLDETVTVALDPSYKPTPADLERASKRGSKVYGPTLTHRKTGERSWNSTMQYHIPFTVLPAAIQQKLRPGSSRSSATFHAFDLVPQAYADDSLLAAQDSGWLPAPNSQAEVTGFGTIAVIANVLAEASKVEEEETLKSLGADLPLALVDALEDSLTFNNWMHELNEMEDCAKNPTNPLAQKAKDGPDYQHDVLDQMDAAKEDVQWSAVPMAASDVAGYLSHFLPFAGGAVTTLILSTQDEAVSQYAEGRINDARKNYTPCEDKRPARAGSFEFTEHRSSSVPGNEQEENGTAAGSFQFKQDPHGFPVYGGEGEAKLEIGFKGRTYINQSHTHLSGPLQVDVTGRGTPRDATLTVTFHAEDTLTYQYSCSGKCNNNYGSSDETHSFAFSCEFNDVDLVRGGTYTISPRYGTSDTQTACKVKIPPQ